MHGWIIQWHFFAMIFAWLPWFIFLGTPMITKIISDNNNKALKATLKDLTDYSNELEEYIKKRRGAVYDFKV